MLFLFFLIKNVAQFLFRLLYIQTFVQKKGWTCTYSGICSASCHNNNGLHYVHAN